MYGRKTRGFCVVILAAIIMTALLSGISAAQLSCSVASGGCPVGQTEVFQMSANDDAHASNDGSYNEKVCCDDPSIAITGGTGACFGTIYQDYDIVLRLSGPSDAHVEKNTQTNAAYDGNDVCISAPGASEVRCFYAAPADVCSDRFGSGYTCVARLSGDTDAHVSGCSAANGYDQICCRIQSVWSPSTERLTFGSDHYYLSLGENKLIPFTVRNIEAAPDNITIKLHGYDTVTFDYSCGPGCSISNDNRRLRIYDMSVFEGRTYFFRILSSTPGTAQLEFNVTIESDPNMYEIYTIDITTGYPVFFPGLGTWALPFMTAAAGVVFLFYRRKDK